MPVDVVLDSPHRYVFRAPRNAIRLLAGWLLMLVAVVASVPSLLLSFLVADYVFGPPPTSDNWIRQIPQGTATAVWAFSVAATIVGSGVGLKLLRGRRHLVLFLRRFGFDGATAAVTFAIASSLGSAWRLVTLDDNEVAPLGASPATIRMLQLADFGSAVGRAIGRLTQISNAIWGAIIVTMWGMVIAGAIGHSSFPDALLKSAVSYLEPVSQTFKAGRLLHPLGWDLHSAFLVMSAFVLAYVIAAMIAIPIFLLVIPLAIPMVFVRSTFESMRTAEAKKQQVIGSPRLMQGRAAEIARQGRGVFAPRLLVLRVTSTMWQYAVEKLAAVSSAILIDISEPTESLLWEIQTLKPLLGSKFVVIGERERVLRLGTASTGPSRELAHRLAVALDGQRVLAYTTDRRGQRRFARALRNRLDTLPAPASAERRLPGAARPGG
jgi:hypothetical protein